MPDKHETRYHGYTLAEWLAGGKRSFTCNAESLVNTLQAAADPTRLVQVTMQEDMQHALIVGVGFDSAAGSLVLIMQHPAWEESDAPVAQALAATVHITGL